MINNYEKRHQVTEFKAKDFYTIQVPKKTVLLILQLFDCSARLSDKRAIYMSFR
jgi:hypothetical protein